MFIIIVVHGYYGKLTKHKRWKMRNKKNFPQSHHFEILIINILEIPKKKNFTLFFPVNNVPEHIPMSLYFSLNIIFNNFEIFY